MRFHIPQKSLQEWKESVLPKIPDLVYVVCNQDLYLIQRRDGRDHTIVFDADTIEILTNCLYQKGVSVYKGNFNEKENVVYITDVNRDVVREALMVYYR